MTPEGSPSRFASNGVVALALAGFVVVALLRAVLAVGFPGPYDPDRFQTVPDAVGDVLVTRAVFEGRDPYAPLDVLARAEGLPAGDLPEEAVHFRFPGALLVQAPLVLVPPERAPAVATVVNLVALAAVGWLVWRWLGVAQVALALPVVAVTPPFLEMLAHGPAVGVLTVGLAATWWAAGHRGDRGAGAVSGVLAVLRGFPLLLAAGFALVGRRAAAMWAAGVFVGLNLAGMAWFGLSPVEILDASGRATSAFGPDVHNGSLAGMLMRAGAAPAVAAVAGLVVVGGAWAWATWGTADLDRMFLLTIPAMLLASPLSWPTYHLLLLPWAGVLVARGAGRGAGVVAVGAGVVYLASGAIGVEIFGVGTFLISLVSLAVAAVVVSGSCPLLSRGNGDGDLASAVPGT